MNKPIVKPGFVYLLGCMVMLHAFWFFMFFKILAKFLKSGKAEDSYNENA